MKRILSILIIAFITPLFTTGCYNSEDINRTLFVTTLLVDIGKSKAPMLYAETFIAKRGNEIETGNEVKNIFKATGKNLFDAARNLSLSSNYTFNYSQCRAVIFTPKAARYGLDNFLDLFDRGQELTLRSYVFISDGDIENILNVSMPEEQYIGVYLSELAQNTKLSSKGSILRIDEFFNNRFLDGNVNVINFIGLKNIESKPRLAITGLAVLKEDKLVDRLSFEEGMAFNLLRNTFKRGVINTINPEHSNKLTSLEILKNTTKSKLNYDGKKIHIKKRISSKTVLAFTEKSIHITDSKEVDTLETSAEEYIERICQKLFSDYQQKNIDIFNIQREFEMKYPKTRLKNCLEIADLDVEADVYIKGSSDTTNFK